MTRRELNIRIDRTMGRLVTVGSWAVLAAMVLILLAWIATGIVGALS